MLRPESYWYREVGKVVSVDQVSMILALRFLPYSGTRYSYQGLVS